MIVLGIVLVPFVVSVGKMLLVERAKLKQAADSLRRTDEERRDEIGEQRGKALEDSIDSEMDSIMALLSPPKDLRSAAA